jgi:Flp pilus assembly protein TadG
MRTTKMMNYSRRLFRCNSGQSLVETALAVSLCSVLILGAAEFGRLAYAGIEISDSARAGVEYGSQSLPDSKDFSNMTAAASLSAPDIPNLTLTASNYCKCSNGNSSTCTTTSCPIGTRNITYVQVVTSGTINPLIYVPGLPKSYSLSGKAVMRVVD